MAWTKVGGNCNYVCLDISMMWWAHLSTFYKAVDAFTTNTGGLFPFSFQRDGP